MSVHAYPPRALWGDDLRALAGLIPCLAILAGVPLAPPAMAVVSGFAALFAIFGLRTVQRHRTRLALSGTALRVLGPRGTEIPWAALDAMRLSYYAVRRDSARYAVHRDGTRRDNTRSDNTRSDGAGWMQLVLRAGRAKLSLDSRIEGFPFVVARAAEAAAARRLALAPTTLANLKALGLTPAEPPAAVPWAAGEQA